MTESICDIELQKNLIFASVIPRVLSESQVQQQSHTSRSYHCANQISGTVNEHSAQNPGQGDTDVAMLIEDIWVAEGEDDDSTQEFIAGVVGNELAEEIVKTTQF